MVVINSTKFGSITIDGKTYYEDVIVTWDNEVREIHLTTRHLFGVPEFSQIALKKLDLLIIGTGVSSLCNMSDELKEQCKERGIELIEIVSRRAIEKFNEAFDQGKKVAAFIHVTC